MNKIKAFFGYFLAALGVPLILVTFMGLETFPQMFVSATGIEISPWFTGGEVARTIQQDRYETRIHRPVFDGLFWERKEGFVQVVWAPLPVLPERVEEQIDYDGDGLADFAITLRPTEKTAELQAIGPEVLELSGPYLIGDGMGVRVGLINR